MDLILPDISGKSSPGTENADEEGEDGCDDIDDDDDDDDDGIEVRSGSRLYLKHDGGPLYVKCQYINSNK